VQVTTEALEQCEVLLTVNVDKKQTNKSLQKAAGKISRQYRIPGFRPGKAPYQVVIRRFGAEVLQEQIWHDDGERLTKKALQEAGVTPYGQIKLEELSIAPFAFTIRIPTEPNIVLADYRNRVEEIPAIDEITNKDIDDVLKNLQDQHASWVPVEKPAEIGNVISMLVTQKDGETVLVENESVDYPIDQHDDDELAENEHLSLDNEFTDNLVGLVEGETKVFTIAYPPDYKNTNIAGKEITFIIEVSAIKEKEVDPLDDEFAQAIGNHETMSAWRDEISDSIRKNRENNRDRELGQQLINQVVESAEKIEWSPTLENQIVADEISRQAQQLQARNLNIEIYSKMQQKTVEEWEDSIRETIVDNLKRGLVLDGIAKAEGITVTDEEVIESAQFMAQLSGQGEQFLQQVIDSPNVQAEIAQQLLAEKVGMRLADFAKGVPVDNTDDNEAETKLLESSSDESTSNEAETDNSDTNKT